MFYVLVLLLYHIAKGCVCLLYLMHMFACHDGYCARLMDYSKLLSQSAAVYPSLDISLDLVHTASEACQVAL